MVRKMGVYATKRPESQYERKRSEGETDRIRTKRDWMENQQEGS